MIDKKVEINPTFESIDVDHLIDVDGPRKGKMCMCKFDVDWYDYICLSGKPP